MPIDVNVTKQTPGEPPTGQVISSVVAALALLIRRMNSDGFTAEDLAEITSGSGFDFIDLLELAKEANRLAARLKAAKTKAKGQGEGGRAIP